MKKFLMPANYSPDFQKSYDMYGNTFDVQVENRGLYDNNPNVAPHLVWLFRVLVRGHVVDEGPFRWDPSDRQLTDEQVANNIASFYAQSTAVSEAQTLMPKRTDERDFERLITKCRSFMFECLIVDLSTLENSIVSATMGADEDDWRIVLESAAEPGKLFEFTHKSTDTRTIVSTYVKAHSFFTEL